MATHHMRKLVAMKDTDNVDVIGVCDIYDKRLDAAAALTGGKKYKNYNSMLENKDIDYVLVGATEHWHFQMTMDAADAGKHIYCEKPMTQFAHQAKEVVQRIHGSKILMQVGVQGTSDNSYKTANKYIKDGALGKVVLAQIDYSRNSKQPPWSYKIDPDARPGENLDWDTWLGSAPKRPWDPERYFRWRNYWDYSTGIASDLFIHRVTRIIRSLDLRFPERGVGTGGKFYYTDTPAEVPDTFNILLDYPEGLTVQLVSSLANDMRIQHAIRGNKATLLFTRTGFEIKAQRQYREEVEEIIYEKTGAEDVVPHHQNLMAAIRTGDELNCDCNLGYYGVVACEMGTESYRRRKYMTWDGPQQRLLEA
jgi:predicted dehydrogenase